MSSPKDKDASNEAPPLPPGPAPSDATTRQDNEPAQPEKEESESDKADSSRSEEGEVDSEAGDNQAPSAKGDDSQPPLPHETVPDGPPLPNEPPPPQDDGWDCLWDPSAQSWYFYNRFTSKSQWENPRVPSADPTAATTAAVPPAPGTQPAVPQPPVSETPAAGGYNPAIHGDYDPNAWYAQGNDDTTTTDHSAPNAADPTDPAALYTATASFNRFTGQFQAPGEGGAEKHSDEAKSHRQMNAFFDVDAAANAHDGRSLKAERSHKKPSKSELKAFKEKRKARKEEKRRAWLRD